MCVESKEWTPSTFLYDPPPDFGRREWQQESAFASPRRFGRPAASGVSCHWIASARATSSSAITACPTPPIRPRAPREACEGFSPAHPQGRLGYSSRQVPASHELPAPQACRPRLPLPALYGCCGSEDAHLPSVKGLRQPALSRLDSEWSGSDYFPARSI